MPAWRSTETLRRISRSALRTMSRQFTVNTTRLETKALSYISSVTVRSEIERAHVKLLHLLDLDPLEHLVKLLPSNDIAHRRRSPTGEPRRDLHVHDSRHSPKPHALARIEGWARGGGSDGLWADELVVAEKGEGEKVASCERQALAIKEERWSSEDEPIRQRTRDMCRTNCRVRNISSSFDTMRYQRLDSR